METDIRTVFVFGGYFEELRCYFWVPEIYSTLIWG